MESEILWFSLFSARTQRLARVLARWVSRIYLLLLLLLLLLVDLPSHCICGDKFTVSHALSCKKGGL